MPRYNQIIKYIDGTWDEDFNKARKWAQEHKTTFVELMDKRDLPKRYFQIGPEPIIPPEPSEDDLKRAVRIVRNSYLAETDPMMLEDYPITPEEKELCKQYRQYLRDYTEQEEWWLQNPLTFEDWKQGREFVEEME